MTEKAMALTTFLGSAPVVNNQQELDDICGMICAVEFGSQELLGYGETWEAALNDVAARGNAEKDFYRYAMPLERFDFCELSSRMREMERDAKDS